MGAKQAVAMPTELSAALADVRSDATATDWCLCGFEATTLDLVMVGSGTGGVGAMAALVRVRVRVSYPYP